LLVPESTFHQQFHYTKVTPVTAQDGFADQVCLSMNFPEDALSSQGEIEGNEPHLCRDQNKNFHQRGSSLLIDIYFLAVCLLLADEKKPDLILNCRKYSPGRHSAVFSVVILSLG